MTLGQLIIKTFFLQVILVIVKVAFFDYLNNELWPIIVLFYVIIGASAVGVVRRFGDINYFEAFLILLLWIIVGLAVDYVITSGIAGQEIFSNKHFWFSYLAIVLGVLLFDRKEHLATRRAGGFKFPISF